MSQYTIRKVCEDMDLLSTQSNKADAIVNALQLSLTHDIAVAVYLKDDYDQCDFVIWEADEARAIIEAIKAI